jgi:hypothetical protein
VAKVANAIIIKELLEARTDPNARDGLSEKQLLYYIVERGNIELV